jgi:hypothetical protein
MHPVAKTPCPRRSPAWGRRLAMLIGLLVALGAGPFHRAPAAAAAGALAAPPQAGLTAAAARLGNATAPVGR